MIDLVHRWRIVILVVAVAVFSVAMGLAALVPKEQAAPTLRPNTTTSPDNSSFTPTPATEAQDPASLATTIDGQRMRLETPSVPIGLALFLHGVGGDVDSMMDSEWLRRLVDQGWAIASSDFHGNAWGAPHTTTDVENVTAWAQEQIGMQPSLLISDSMGGLTALNAITRSERGTACWYGVAPVTDLRTVVEDPGFSAEIAAAYGGDPAEADNPIENVDQLARSGTLIRMVGAGADTLISNPLNSVALRDALTAAGAPSSYLELPVDHGAAELYDAADLLSFAQGCAQ